MFLGNQHNQIVVFLWGAKGSPTYKALKNVLQGQLPQAKKKVIRIIYQGSTSALENKAYMWHTKPKRQRP